MNALIVASCLMLNLSTASFRIDWGLQDSVISFGQSIYAWVRYTNIDSTERALNKANSHIELIAKLRGEEYSVAHMEHMSASSFLLSPKNSIFNYHGYSNEKYFTDVADTVMVDFVLRSKTKEFIPDSLRNIKLIPHGSPKFVSWFAAFDSVTNSKWFTLRSAQRKEICFDFENQRSTLVDKVSPSKLLVDASKSKISALCGTYNQDCIGIPIRSSNWAFLSQMSICQEKYCSDEKRGPDVCLKSDSLQDSFTLSVLGKRKEVLTPRRGYHCLVGSSDTVFVPWLFYGSDRKR